MHTYSLSVPVKAVQHADSSEDSVHTFAHAYDRPVQGPRRRIASAKMNLRFTYSALQKNATRLNFTRALLTAVAET